MKTDVSPCCPLVFDKVLVHKHSHEHRLHSILDVVIGCSSQQLSKTSLGQFHWTFLLLLCPWGRRPIDSNQKQKTHINQGWINRRLLLAIPLDVVSDFPRGEDMNRFFTQFNSLFMVCIWPSGFGLIRLTASTAASRIHYFLIALKSL